MRRIIGNLKKSTFPVCALIQIQTNRFRGSFQRIPRSRIALETGTHSLWVSRLLTQLCHEVIVAHARNVGLIWESNRKDDRLDARTLARLARIDPGLLGPVRHRSAQAQIHLTVIRGPERHWSPTAKIRSRNRNALHSRKNFVEELRMSALVEH